MSIPNLPVDFKDDILNTGVNQKRKYQQTYNSDGSVSFEDVTAYQQKGSNFGAQEVNETNGAVNNIYSERILDLDELELVTEPGFFVDAQAVKEAHDSLNSKTEFEDLTLDISNSNWKTGYYTLKAKTGVLYMDYYIMHGSDAQASLNYAVGTIPAEYRPQRSYDIRSAAWCANLNGQRYGANIRINAQGVVSFVGGGTFREAGFSFAIPI